MADAEAISAVSHLDENKAIEDQALLIKSLIMICLVVIGFIFHSQIGIESSTVALSAAAIIMVIGRQNIDYAIGEVEWPTILFFVALFIVVGGLDETGVIGTACQSCTEYYRRTPCGHYDGSAVGFSSAFIGSGQYSVRGYSDSAGNSLGRGAEWM